MTKQKINIFFIFYRKKFSLEETFAVQTKISRFGDNIGLQTIVIIDFFLKKNILFYTSISQIGLKKLGM